MKNRIITYLRFILNIGIDYTVLMFALWGVNWLLTVLSNGSIGQFFKISSVYSILFFALFFSLMMFSNYVSVRKNVLITDSSEEKKRVKELMIKLRWKLMTETDMDLVFAAPLWQGPLRDQISFTFTEKEIYIAGPSYIVDKVMSKRRYALTEGKGYDM